MVLRHVLRIGVAKGLCRARFQIDAELGAPANSCVLFAGELLGPWTGGRITAPLHFVNEGHQVSVTQP